VPTLSGDPAQIPPDHSAPHVGPPARPLRRRLTRQRQHRPAVPNKQLRELIERHDDHVQWVRHVTLEDTKVRKKAIAGLRKILDALQGGKPAVVSAAMVFHPETAEQALAAVLESTQHDRTSPGA
jgi:hypothetical protein